MKILARCVGEKALTEFSGERLNKYTRVRTNIRNTARSDGQARCLGPRGGVQLAQGALR